MKKLSITKEQFEKSKYFTNKYGKLAFVSESGKLFKTSKGNVLKFDEGMRREVVPMNGRKSFGRKAMEEDDGDGFTLFSYETPVARLERRDDGSGLDFTLLSDYLSSTTLTHIHSWLLGHGQEDIPTKKLLRMNVGETVPVSESTKKLVKEGAGAGYTVKIKDLKFGKILSKKLIPDKYFGYYECQVEILPGEYEIAAEDYYNDFFWQEHEFGETPTAKIDGGVATVEYSKQWEDDEQAEDDLVSNVEDVELNISFDYGWGWTHVDLPREKIEADHVNVENDGYYAGIDKIELNAPDLADAVNSGHKSIDDMEDEQAEEDEDEEPINESFGDEDGWRVFDYGEDFPYTERYTVLDHDGYQFFISHNGGVGAFTEDAIDEIDSDKISDILEIEIEGQTYRPRELDSDEISNNRIVQKGLKLIKVKYQYEKEDDLMTESYDDEWTSVGAAFDEFRQRLWRYTRKDRENRMEFFQDCMQKCEEAFKEYHDACVAED